MTGQASTVRTQTVLSACLGIDVAAPACLFRAAFAVTTSGIGVCGYAECVWVRRMSVGAVMLLGSVRWRWCPPR